MAIQLNQEFYYRSFLPGNTAYDDTGIDIGAPRHNNVRGLFIAKDAPITQAILFQFNPTEVRTKKNNTYFNRERTGVSAIDTIWISGGENTYEFTLMLDATAGSNTRHFGGKKAKIRYGRETYLTLSDESIQDSDLISYGTLATIAKLHDFIYPKEKESDKPRFIRNTTTERNNSRASNQFEPPPSLIFVYGPIYLECKLKDLSVRHTAYNQNLAPIRSEVSVSLVVTEGSVVKTNIDILHAADTGQSNTFIEQPIPKTSGISTSPEIPVNIPI